MESKPHQKEDPVWSILPLYDMYQNTFNKLVDPPQYGEASSAQHSTYTPSHVSTELDTAATAVTSYENLVHIDPSTTNLTGSSPSLIVADESTNTWRETLLDNIDKLRNFSSSKNLFSNNMELSVHFTEDVGQCGVAPKHIDPLQFEYKQGDFLNGYILIKNTSDKPIPFDMFYVLFEGVFAIQDTNSNGQKTNVKIKKFLEMYDFAASWNQSAIDRLILESFSNQYSCPQRTDSLDGAQMCILTDRKLMPGILYKRFFTFKIPNRLLDSECNDHQLPSHMCLPPTLGVCQKERQLMQTKFVSSNDFSFVGTLTSYSVLARFIGKASYYEVKDKFDLSTKLIDEKGDEFIIFKDCSSFIRVIQEPQVESTSEKLVRAEMSRVLYENLLGRIKEKIDLGNRIKRVVAGQSDSSFQEIDGLFQSAGSGDADAEELKARQLYTRFDNITKSAGSKYGKPKDYDISVHIVKKKLLGAVKFLGMLLIKSPKNEYILNYMSPKRFTTGSSSNKHLWKLEVPIDVSFVPAKVVPGMKIPHISKVTTELVVVSLKAGPYPIPIEFTHDHLFQNKSCQLFDLTLMDTFENIVIKPMKKYGSELYQLVKECGEDQFKVEKSLFEDVCALAALDVKSNHLALRESQIIDSNGNETKCESRQSIQLTANDGIFSLQFTVVMDATKAQKKGYNMDELPANYSSVDEFCLVPTFQNCSMARMYFLRIIIRISTGETVELKLPVNIEKTPTN